MVIYHRIRYLLRDTNIYDIFASLLPGVVMFLAMIGVAVFFSTSVSMDINIQSLGHGKPILLSVVHSRAFGEGEEELAIKGNGRSEHFRITSVRADKKLTLVVEIDSASDLVEGGLLQICREKRYDFPLPSVMGGVVGLRFAEIADITLLGLAKEDLDEVKKRRPGKVSYRIDSRKFALGFVAGACKGLENDHKMTNIES